MPSDLKEDLYGHVLEIAKKCSICGQVEVCDCLSGNYPFSWTTEGRGCSNGPNTPVDIMAAFCREKLRTAPHSCSLGCDCPYLSTAGDGHSFCGAKEALFEAFWDENNG